jgi:hypothetical protein
MQFLGETHPTLIILPTGWLSSHRRDEPGDGWNSRF